MILNKELQKQYRIDIKIFENEKTLKNYNMVKNKYFPNQNESCVHCNDSIFWQDIKFRIGKDNQPKIDGLHSETIRTINEVNYKLQVCEKCFNSHFPNFKQNQKMNTPNIYVRYMFKIPESESTKHRNKMSTTIENQIKKYGEEEGKRRFNEYCEKQRITNTLEYKKQKYGMTEEQFREFNLSRAVTLKNQIKKHGEEEGKKRFDEYCNLQKYAGCSLEYFTDKYGEVEGTMFYKKLNKSKTHSAESYIKRYGEEDGLKRFKKYCAYNRPSIFVSLVANNFFKNLDDKIEYYKIKSYSAYKTKEWFVYLEDEKRMIFLDYCIPKLKFAVEFNGRIWHADPRFFTATDTPNPYEKTLTSEMIWQNEKVRSDMIKKYQNIDVFVVWEDDNYEEKTNEIISIINERLKKQNAN